MTILNDFGMIGLGTMGRNFLLNVADHGFSAAGLDLAADKVEALTKEAAGRPVFGTSHMADFVASLSRPRRIMLLVPAGKPVDAVIADLLPHLEAGDLIIDGGNSHFADTERRLLALREKNIRFLGVGVSGGSEGARRGPSIMPGGDLEAYSLVQPVLEAVAAKVGGEPCVAYMGNGAAGHYVKMVHNGIEYGLMQLIAEAYDLMRRLGGLENPAIQQLFARWNTGRLRSFLIEISAEIFTRRDAETGKFLIDLILDKAKQKGTGKWTSQTALDLGVPIPTIDAAVSMRGISAFKTERVAAAAQLPPAGANGSYAAASLGQDLEQALYFAFLATYAQGLHLLAEASLEFGYQLDLTAIARIWRGGCIIRADLLENIRQSFAETPGIRNLVLAPHFQQELLSALPAMRRIAAAAAEQGIPLLAMSSALHYVQSFYSADLPLNLVQAQRDFFGAHTFERVDREGVFHLDWQ